MEMSQDFAPLGEVDFRYLLFQSLLLTFLKTGFRQLQSLVVRPAPLVKAPAEDRETLSPMSSS